MSGIKIYGFYYFWLGHVENYTTFFFIVFSDTLTGTGSSGLKFDSAPVTQDPDKAENSDLVHVMSTTPASESFAPTNKEINTSQPKSSNNNGNFTASSIEHLPNSVTNQDNQQDSFIKSSSTNTSQG